MKSSKKWCAHFKTSSAVECKKANMGGPFSTTCVRMVRRSPADGAPVLLSAIPVPHRD
jgi:hypothetical protein